MASLGSFCSNAGEEYGAYTTGAAVGADGKLGSGAEGANELTGCVWGTAGDGA